MFGLGSGKHNKSARRTSSSKSHTSPKGEYAQPEAQPEPENAESPTSFLFIVNELPTNDNPDTPGSVPARYVHQRWHPPDTMRGFFAQQPGHVYRWTDGVVSLAEGYQWTVRAVGNPLYANGTIYSTDSQGQTIWPTYFRAATVFYCNHFDKFFTARGDAGTRDIATCLDAEDWWHPLSFIHDHDISYVNHIGDHDYLAVRTATWIEQLLPRVYRRHHHQGPAHGGLAGLLPIVIALVAFSCANMDDLYRVLIQDRAWRGHRWVPHQRETGQREGRGMVVTVFTDPENPYGSTMESIQEVEDGRTPIFR